MMEGTPIKTAASCPIAVSIAQFIICSLIEPDRSRYHQRSSRQRKRLFFLSSRRRRNRQIGVPHIGGTFPISISLFFPDLEVFAAIVDRFATDVIHGQFVRTAHPRHRAVVAEFHFGWSPTDHESRRGENIFPQVPNRFLRRCTGCVRREDNGVIGIESDGLLEILSCCRFGPLCIEITKNSLRGPRSTRVVP